MGAPEPTDADLYAFARDTLALMDAGISYPAVIGMHARVRAAYLAALRDMASEQEAAEDLDADDAAGLAN